MPRVTWSENALRDLRRLHDFIAVKDRKAAARAVVAMRQGCRVLGLQPELGRTIEDALPEYRERIITFGQRAYVALYRNDGKLVTILAVRHGLEDKY